MDGVYESVMLSDVLEDDDRFRAVIDEAICEKTVPAFKAYTKESKKSKTDRVKAARGEANEAEEYAKELGVHEKLFGAKAGGSGSGSGGKKGKKGKQDSEADLAALIKKNQASRKNKQSSFLDNLAAKYAAPSRGKSKKRAVVDDDDDEEEPSEEAFQAAAGRLKKPKVETGSSSGSSRQSARSKK